MILNLNIPAGWSVRIFLQELIKQTKNEDTEKRSLQLALKEIEVRVTMIYFAECNIRLNKSERVMFC